MTHPLLTDALKEAYVNYNANVDIVETLVVSTSTDKLAFCTGYKDFIGNDASGNPITFKPAPFKFSLPAQDDSGAHSLNITIENVNGDVITFVETAKTANKEISITYRTYFADSVTPQTPRPVKMTLSSSQATLEGVTFQAAVADLVNRSFPSGLYTYSRFSGLRQ